jgi:small-conductance mechanosensitive channel
VASNVGAFVLVFLNALAVWLAPASYVLAAQVPPAAAPSTQPSPAPPDVEAERDRAMPVLLGGAPVVWINTGVGPYSTAFRADRIGQRLLAVVRDRTISDPAVTVTEVDGSSELRVGPRLLMVVTAQDARSLGGARVTIAQHYASELEAAIRAERDRYAPATLIRSGIYGLAATAILIAIIWLVFRVTRAIRQAVDRRRERGLLLPQPELVSADHFSRAVDRVIAAIRLVAVLIAINVYLTIVLGLFPWTRGMSLTLLGYITTPIRMVATAFVGYLPKLLFVVVIAAMIYTSIRLVAVFFQQIRQGRLVFASFPAEWADPTNKIVKVLLVAFGVVVAFPYLPASDSPAFAGVSVFMGVLISFSSGSALSNIIAGIVLTYTGAFRLGDRVKLGDAFGDIIEMSLLATHVRTIKNEDVTIPNSIVLSSSVINYSHASDTAGLILHTTVTIGYDAPWRKVHDLLIEAALATPDVLDVPRPFVWQTALNDFYVSYEINAYTRAPANMIDTYAVLHARIQDAFFAAGVEIMSPHYTALRDGNTVTIPEAFRAAEYRAPAFRVEDAIARERT